MRKVRKNLWIVICTVLISGLLSPFLGAVVNPLDINAGSPLKVRVWQDGHIQVQHLDGAAWDYQIYNSNTYAGANTKLFLNGGDQNLAYRGSSYMSLGTDFTVTSHSMPTAWSVETVWQAGTTGVSVTQLVSYTNGDNKIRVTWTVSHSGPSTYSDVRLIHYQDTYLDNQDSGFGHWNAAQGMVYISNPNPAIAGIMGMYGGASSPASRYEAMGYSPSRNSANNGWLSNTVKDDVSHDAGYALQWNRATLAPGETWSVTMFEKFTEPGEVLVTAPSPSSADAGQTVSLDFTVENLQSTADTFDLAVTASPNNWSTSLPGGETASIAANTSATITVNVTIPGGAAVGATESVKLTATAQSDSAVTNFDGTSLTVSDPTTTNNLTITANGNGSTNPSPGVRNYTTGTTIDVTAIPDSGSSFSGWSGDVPAGHENDNPVSILVDSDKAITATFSGSPSVATAAVTNVTMAGADGGGNVTADGGASVSARGVCWSTSINPTISGSHTTDGSGTGTFSSTISGLSAGTTYHVRAYATNANGTAYGNDVQFTTSSVSLATITTTDVSNVASSSAQSGGNISADGGASVTARGVCWSTSPEPTTAGSHSTDGSGTGAFTSSLTGLAPGTTYYVRAYAVNVAGTAYGNQQTFNTDPVVPTVSTTAASNISSDSAQGGGNISADGGASVTARGVCWSTSPEPTTDGSHSTDGSGTGAFTSSLTGLAPGTTYYVRAYAVNSVDTAYGNQVTFSTEAVPPTVTTTAASNISSDSAQGGGNISADGGASVSARGVCWSTSPEPTTAGSHSTDGSGTGAFTSSISGLAPGTTYYVRAYAVNSVDTAYGNQVTFTTDAVVPTVQTAQVSEITASGAFSGGTVSNEGGADVTARGVCWSTSPNPTIAGGKTLDGSGPGDFSSVISGLTHNTTYYVRAWATNRVGTAYGEARTFITEPIPPTVETLSISDVTPDSALCAGRIRDDGGAPVTTRGFCWSTADNPDIHGDSTRDGHGTGPWFGGLEGLERGTTYYVRAYATNRAGTAYGTCLRFQTVGLPTIQIISPADGETVSGTTALTAASSVDAARVDFYMDSELLGTALPVAERLPGDSGETTVQVTMDLRDARFLVTDAEGILRKLDSLGRLSHVFNQRVEVVCAAMGPDGEAWVTFPRDVCINSGPAARLVRIHPATGMVTLVDSGFENMPAPSIGDSRRLRFDARGRLYYLVSLRDHRVSLRRFHPISGPEVIWTGYAEILAWQLGVDGSVDLLERRGNDSGLGTLSFNTDGSFAGSRSSAKVFPNTNDFRKHITGALPPDCDILRMFGSPFTNGTVVALSRPDETDTSLVEIRSTSNGEGSMAISLTHLDEVPRACSQTSPASNGILIAAPPVLELSYPEPYTSTATPTELEHTYTLEWNTLEAAHGAHRITAVGHDRHDQEFTHEIEVSVMNLIIRLEARRHSDSALTFSVEYADLSFAITNPGNIQVDHYSLYRREENGEDQQVADITPAELENGTWSYKDRGIARDCACTYRVLAFDDQGRIITVSNEETI